MGLSKKPYIENNMQAAEGKLAARLDLLKSRGLDDTAIRRDSLAKKFKAEIRQAKQRLASIAAQEKQNQDLASMKIQKAQAAKEEKNKKAAPAKQPKAPAKKAKKEKEKKPAAGE